LEFSKQVDGNSTNNRLFDNGFLVGCKANTLRFLPPLYLKHDDIDSLIVTLDALLTNAPMESEQVHFELTAEKS